MAASLGARLWMEWRRAGDEDLTEASTWAQPAVLWEPLEAVFQQHGDDQSQVRYLTRAGSKNKAKVGVSF